MEQQEKKKRSVAVTVGQAVLGVLIALLAISYCTEQPEGTKPAASASVATASVAAAAAAPLDEKKDALATGRSTNEAAIAALHESGFTDIQAHKQSYIDNKPADREAYLYDVAFKADTTWGGAQDFNGLAGKLVPAVQKLFSEHPSAERMLVHVKNNAGQNWVNVQVRRSALPKNFSDLTYLEAFALLDLDPAMAGVRDNLCAFWAKYQSARPEDITKMQGCM